MAEFTDLRSAYVGSPLTQDMLFNVELVDPSIKRLSNSKAPGLDELTTEHFKYTHSAIGLDLTTLCKLMLNVGFVPDRRSFSVHIPKDNCSRGQSVTVNDFRAISVCSVYMKSFRNWCQIDLKM